MHALHPQGSFPVCTPSVDCRELSPLPKSEVRDRHPPEMSPAHSYPHFEYKILRFPRLFDSQTPHTFIKHCSTSDNFPSDIIPPGIIPPGIIPPDTMTTNPTTSPLTDYGHRLIPSLVDEYARTDPDYIFALIPKTANFADGLKEITISAFARAVNEVASRIDSKVGKSATFETMAYIGPSQSQFL